MRWKDGRRSDNVEDQRGRGVSPRTLGGGIIGILVIIVIGLLMGADPVSLLSAIIGQSGGSLDGMTPPVPLSAADNESADFVSVVLADTEDTWLVIFNERGMDYTQPKLVLFSGGVDSRMRVCRIGIGSFLLSDRSKSVY